MFIFLIIFTISLLTFGSFIYSTYMKRSKGVRLLCLVSTSLVFGCDDPTLFEVCSLFAVLITL